MRGFITFFDGGAEDDQHNVIFSEAEAQELKRKILNIAEGRIEFVQSYSDFYVTIIFLADLRKRSKDPLIALKELQELLVPLADRIPRLLKVHLLCDYDEGDEKLLVKIGNLDEPMD